MAKSSAKKILHRNNRFLRKLSWSLLSIHSIVVFVLIFWHQFALYGWDWLPYYLSIAFLGCLFKYLQKLSRPVFLPAGEIAVEIDLLGPGLHQYLLDIFYIVLASELCSVFSSYGWWLLAIIPCYATFSIIKLIFPHLSLSNSLVSMFQMDKPLNVPSDDADKKSKRSMKPKKPKIKFVRG